MLDQIVTLPPAEEMMGELCNIDNSSHLRQHLYPKLAAEAGKELHVENVVLHLSLSVANYTRGLPPTAKREVEELAPEFLDAMIYDEKLRKVAKAFFREANAKAAA